MPNMKMDQTWTLVLSVDELRLVLMALGGRLYDQHVEEAKVLGDLLTERRVNEVATRLQQNEQLHGKLLEAMSVAKCRRKS